MDFRHLSAFQKVYQEKNYASAGQQIFATRKSVVRMMQNLERNFDCVLFVEGLRGELMPSAFAERLFNDLRFLNAARHRMKDHIAAIHENGRILNVGCSSVVFRTREFRNLFRELQSLDGIRACYSPINSADAGKALVSGHCDYYIGCWKGTATRFVTQDVGRVTFRTYRRGGGGSFKSTHGNAGSPAFVVALDGQLIDLGAMAAGDRKWEVLEDSRWLHWLDHPEKCPADTVVCGPDVQIDSDRWQIVPDDLVVPRGETLYASFLRQHPYEFMPTLTGKIQHRVVS